MTSTPLEEKRGYWVTCRLFVMAENEDAAESQVHAGTTRFEGVDVTDVEES